MPKLINYDLQQLHIGHQVSDNVTTSPMHNLQITPLSDYNYGISHLARGTPSYFLIIQIYVRLSKATQVLY